MEAKENINREWTRINANKGEYSQHLEVLPLFIRVNSCPFAVSLRSSAVEFDFVCIPGSVFPVSSIVSIGIVPDT